ncbi:hypothetical protein GVAV_003446 [Gurleya vavrai]
MFFNFIIVHCINYALCYNIKYINDCENLMVEVTDSNSQTKTMSLQSNPPANSFAFYEFDNEKIISDEQKNILITKFTKIFVYNLTLLNKSSILKKTKKSPAIFLKKMQKINYIRKGFCHNYNALINAILLQKYTNPKTMLKMLEIIKYFKFVKLFDDSKSLNRWLIFCFKQIRNMVLNEL